MRVGDFVSGLFEGFRGDVLLHGIIVKAGLKTFTVRWQTGQDSRYTRGPTAWLVRRVFEVKDPKVRSQLRRLAPVAYVEGQGELR